MNQRTQARDRGAGTLLLVPTELELRRLEDLGGFPADCGALEICGFGPIAAAARTAQLIARRRPARALLIGICGAYDVARQPVGTALEFDEVGVVGVGVGEGAALIPPPRLGFPQWPGSAERSSAIFDRLPLATQSPADPPRRLLTTCAASADAAQAAVRCAHMPGAVAEDMEAFAVALACALESIPLRVVRGVSNEVGDRAPEHWRIPAALAAARELALEILAQPMDWAAPQAWT